MKGGLFKILAVIAVFLSITSYGYCVSDSLVINEFSWNFTVRSSDGGYDQWIELYNLSDTAIDLTQTTITLQGSSSSDWTGAGSVSFNLGNYVNAQTKVIEAHQYFLISNTLTVTIGESSITPDIYIDTKYLFNKPTTTVYPARGIRLVDNEGDVIDAVIYGRHTDASGNPIETNFQGLDPEGFCEAQTEEELKNIPTVNIDNIRSYTTGYYIVRKTSGAVPVDTDQANPDGGTDWVITDTGTPANSPLTPLNPPSVSEFKIMKTSSGMLLSCVVEYFTSYKIYWKNSKNDAWTEVPADNPDITFDPGTGLMTWVDRNSLSITTKSRFYKVTAIQ